MEHKTPSFSRRAVVKAGAGLAAGLTAARMIGGDALAADAQRVARQSPVNPRQRLLLQGGTIISMDAIIGDLAKGNVLIEGTKIAAAVAKLSAAAATIDDSTNMALIPRIIPCHRHSGLVHL